MGGCPIISYQNIQESNGLNDNKQWKRALNIYQNQQLYIDPEDLTDLHIQEKFANSAWKEYKKNGPVV